MGALARRSSSASLGCGIWRLWRRRSRNEPTQFYRAWTRKRAPVVISADFAFRMGSALISRTGYNFGSCSEFTPTRKGHDVDPAILG